MDSLYLKYDRSYVLEVLLNVRICAVSTCADLSKQEGSGYRSASDRGNNMTSKAANWPHSLIGLF